MNILYVITGLGGGGAEKVVADLADQMCNRGHQVKIAYLKGQVVVRPENQSIELIYLGLETFKDSKIAYQNYKKLIQLYQPDVVHAHMVHANIFTRVARKLCPVPKLICTAHSNNEGGKVRMLFYRLTHAWSDLITNVSQSAAKSFEDMGAVPKGGIKAIYNGIKLDKFYKNNHSGREIRTSLGVGSDECMLLAVGRLHDAKDYPNLLRAFKIILESNLIKKKIQLIIVGDGEQKVEIEQMICSLYLENNVQLLGRRDDIAQLMSAADIFVLSSFFEGFGLVVAEAMACETYVVATDCGGVKEVMGGFGLLAPKQNSKALADQLLIALNKPLHDRLENNLKALHYVYENFDLDKITLQWLKIYES